jgi:hypothetical protein
MTKHMDNWNNQWGNVVNKMSEKNITMDDAKALQIEIAAQNAKLSALIASGNITQIRAFMIAYHEAQLHYAARFEIARLKGYKSKLEPIANRYNMSNSIHDIDKKIADAEKYTKDGHKYGIGEFNNTWKDIRDASQNIRKAATDINKERMKERQKLDEKKQGIKQKPMPRRGENRQINTYNNSNESGDQ